MKDKKLMKDMENYQFLWNIIMTKLIASNKESSYKEGNWTIIHKENINQLELTRSNKVLVQLDQTSYIMMTGPAKTDQVGTNIVFQ